MSPGSPLFPELARCAPIHVDEAAVEVARVPEAGLIGDSVNRLLAVQEQEGGERKAIASAELPEVRSRYLPKDKLKPRRA